MESLGHPTFRIQCDAPLVENSFSEEEAFFRNEKITVSGGQATATMADAEIGNEEKARFRSLIQRMVLKK